MERPDSLETALDEALDALVSGDPDAARRVQQRYRHAPEVTGLMDAAGRIRGALAATPSPQAQARHLAAIREAAGRLSKDAPRKRFAFPRPRFVHTFLLRPALVVGLALLLAAPAALALSARAMPGDPLYSTKLAVENVRLAMARDPAKQVDLHVEFAERRVEELDKLTDRGLPAQASAIAPVLSSLQAHQQEAVKGVDSLKQEGKPVGVLGEHVAVTLQNNTARLVHIRSDTGCNPDGSDPRCRVIAIAVTGSEQTLQQVGEAPAPATPGDRTFASPTVPGPGLPRGGARGGQAPAGPDSGQQPGQQPAPGAQGTVPGSGGTGQNPSGGATEPTPSPAAPTTEPNGSVPAPGLGVHPRPGPSGGQEPGNQPSATAEPLPISIDIKPFDSSNTIDVVNRRGLPVIVKASPDFDPSTLDITSICFGHDPSVPGRSDCSAQGRVFPLPGFDSRDLILVFDMSKTGIRAGDTEACLTGRTKDGKTTVRGCDKVSVVAVTPSSAPPVVGSPLPTPEAGWNKPFRITSP
jgi:uncharacterized protein DUF5667